MTGRAGVDERELREYIEIGWNHDGHEAGTPPDPRIDCDKCRALAVLDSLAAELRLAREEIRVREESQIPVIPAGAKRVLDDQAAELVTLKDALPSEGDEEFLLDYARREELRGRPVHARVLRTAGSFVAAAREALGRPS